jgi:hypothetical protein
MDTHSHHPDEMNELERRLAAWQPIESGLDADALLFAAGRASARPSAARFVWPALTACASLLAIALGVWLVNERTERLALARQLRQQSHLLATTPSTSPVADPTPARIEEEPPADSYLASHRALDKGLEAWPISSVVHADPPGTKPPHSPVLQAGRLDALLDP